MGYRKARGITTMSDQEGKGYSLSVLCMKGVNLYPFATRTSELFSFKPSMMAPRPAMFWR